MKTITSVIALLTIFITTAFADKDALPDSFKDFQGCGKTRGR